MFVFLKLLLFFLFFVGCFFCVPRLDVPFRLFCLLVCRQQCFALQHLLSAVMRFWRCEPLSVRTILDTIIRQSRCLGFLQWRIICLFSFLGRSKIFRKISKINKQNQQAKISKINKIIPCY